MDNHTQQHITTEHHIIPLRAARQPSAARSARFAVLARTARPRYSARPRSLPLRVFAARYLRGPAPLVALRVSPPVPLGLGGVSRPPGPGGSCRENPARGGFAPRRVGYRPSSGLPRFPASRAPALAAPPFRGLVRGSAGLFKTCRPRPKPPLGIPSPMKDSLTLKVVLDSSKLEQLHASTAQHGWPACYLAYLTG